MIAQATTRQADDERMRQLHDKHAQPLLRFLLRLTVGDRHAAEDLVQETLLRAWRRLPHLQTHVATPRPWRFTVARNAAIDAARGRSARPVEVSGADVTGHPPPDDPLNAVLDGHDIAAILATLRPEHRYVLIALYVR